MARKKGTFRRAWKWLRDYFRVVGKAIGRIGSDNLTILASGMVYSTLIAIVPCITFLSAFLSALGGLESFSSVLTDWLIDTFGEAEGTFVMEKLTLFSRNAMSLGIFGLITFIISGSLLAVRIDGIINNIFRTRHSRGGIRRYGKIIIFIIVLTVFIALSLSLSQSIREDLYKTIGVSTPLGFFQLVMKEGGQYALIFFIFFFLLYFVPNVRVKLSAALAGSVLGTVVMSIFYQIFTRLIISSVKLSVIYGSLASILLVLIYFYVVWCIIILMAEVTFIYQFRPEKNEDREHAMTPEKEMNEALKVLVEVARSFEKGEGGIAAMVLASRARVTYLRTINYIRTLEKAGLVSQLSSSSYILPRPAEKIMLSDVVSALFSGDTPDDASPSLALFRKAGLSSLEGRTLGDIL